MILKKMFLTLSIIVFSLAFASCSINPNQNYAEQRSKEILACFDNKDADTLKSMFSEKAKSENNLDSQIQNAFDKYVGQSTEYDFLFSGAAGETDNGEWIDKHITPELYNLKTDADEEYTIKYGEYIIYKKDETKVGISWIVLRDKDNNVLAEIG